MEEEKNLKCIKEVFKDFNFSSFELAEAKIENINLHKQKSELEIVLILEKNINLEDLLKFETYIEERFMVKSVNIKIKKENHEKSNVETIEKDWESIAKYVSHKHPMAKALLKRKCARGVSHQ